MPKEKIEIWKCDLCGASLNVTTNGCAEWKVISVPDKQEDRMFHEKVICYSCTEKIISK